MPDEEWQNLIDEDERTLEDIMENGNFDEALAENNARWERVEFLKRMKTIADSVSDD